MAANGISTLANKKLRQEAKLAQAGADRAARNVVEPGRYADTTADITQLPTKYEADNSVQTILILADYYQGDLGPNGKY